MPADVAERRGAQQRITDGVSKSVAVRVAHGPFLRGNYHTAKDQPAPRSEAMEIIAYPHAMMTTWVLSGISWRHEAQAEQIKKQKSKSRDQKSNLRFTCSWGG